MSVRQHIPGNIKRVARCVGYALWLGPDIERWVGVSLILKARLTPQQRAALAYAALRSLDAEDAGKVADLAICGPERGEIAA